jgi:hypothetical protein
MLYVFPIVIPANTTQAAPLKTSLQLTAGTITHVMLQFPPGPLGLAHLYIRNGLNQVWPANPEAQFQSDDETIPWAEEYEIDSPPYRLDAYGWNADDTYPHTITARIELTPANVQASLTDQIKSLLGIGGA